MRTFPACPAGDREEHKGSTNMPGRNGGPTKNWLRTEIKRVRSVVIRTNTKNVLTILYFQPLIVLLI